MPKKERRRILVAEEIHLVAKDNSPRMLLGVNDTNGQPYIQLNDDAGFARTQISLNPDGGPLIAMMRPNGKTLIGFGANRATGVGISINDQEGNVAIHLSSFQDGTRQIEIYDSDGKPIWGAP
jgi:hypothetical protein